VVSVRPGSGMVWVRMGLLFALLGFLVYWYGDSVRMMQSGEFYVLYA